MSARAASAHVVAVEACVPLPDGRVAVVMPHLLGGAVDALVRHRGHLSPGEVVTVLAPVASALGRLHDLGVVHGDVSPGNVLLDLDGRPVLGDLGLGHVVGDVSPGVWGTDGYVAPEVLLGADPTPASDVYALGAVGWLCLSGTVPGPPGLRPELAQVCLAGEGSEPVVAALAAAVSAEPADRPGAHELAWLLFGAAEPEPLRLVAGDDEVSAVTYRLRAAAGRPPSAAASGRWRWSAPPGAVAAAPGGEAPASSPGPPRGRQAVAPATAFALEAETAGRHAGDVVRRTPRTVARSRGVGPAGRRARGAARGHRRRARPVTRAPPRPGRRGPDSGGGAGGAAIAGTAATTGDAATTASTEPHRPANRRRGAAHPAHRAAPRARRRAGRGVARGDPVPARRGRRPAVGRRRPETRRRWPRSPGPGCATPGCATPSPRSRPSRRPPTGPCCAPASTPARYARHRRHRLDVAAGPAGHPGARRRWCAPTSAGGCPTCVPRHDGRGRGERRGCEAGASRAPAGGGVSPGARLRRRTG